MSDSIVARAYEVYTKDSILPLIPIVVWDASTGKVVYATKAAVDELGVGDLLGQDVNSLPAKLFESGLAKLNGHDAGYAVVRRV